MTDAEAIPSRAEQADIVGPMTAEIEALLTDLRQRRADLTAQIASLQGQEATGHIWIDKVRTSLNAQMSSSLTAIDTLIMEAETAARGLRNEIASA